MDMLFSAFEKCIKSCIWVSWVTNWACYWRIDFYSKEESVRACSINCPVRNFNKHVFCTSIMIGFFLNFFWKFVVYFFICNPLVYIWKVFDKLLWSHRSFFTKQSNGKVLDRWPNGNFYTNGCFSIHRTLYIHGTFAPIVPF